MALIQRAARRLLTYLADDPAPRPPPSTPPPASRREEVERAPHDRLIRGVDFPAGGAPALDVPIYGYSGWTVQQVQAALDAIKVGSLIDAHNLLTEMQEDPGFSGPFDLRIKSLVRCDFELRKHPDLPDEAYKALVSNWPRIFDKNDLATSAKYRIPLGVAPATVQWYPDSSLWMPEIRIKETGNLFWYQAEQRFKFTSLNRGQITINDDGSEWVLFKELASKYPYLDGSIRPLAVRWWVKQAVDRYEHNFARVNGQPFKKVKSPAPQRETVDFRDSLLQAQSLMNDGVFAAVQYKDGPSFDLELVETMGEGTIFDRIIERADNYFTWRLLGATDNTKGRGAGSRARAEVHERQTNKYLGSDCDVTSEALSKVLRWWCIYNRFPPEWAPIPHFNSNPPTDEKEMADTRASNSTSLSTLIAQADVMEAKLKASAPEASIDWRKILQDHGVAVTEPGDHSVALSARPSPKL